MKEKSWRTWKSNQNIVMDEELFQNGVMNGTLVKKFVMDAKFDLKVEMDLSMFEMSGWNILQLCNRKFVEGSIEEAATAALFLGILSREPSFVMRYVGTSTCEGLREMMQCYRRQHIAAIDDLHERHRGWRKSTRMEFMSIQKMRSEPSEYMCKTMVILIHLENYFGKDAQEVLDES